MTIDVFADLCVVVADGEVVLRPVPFAEFEALASLVGNGLFPDGEASTLSGWYDPDDLVRSARRSIAYHCDTLANANPDRWALPLGVWCDDQLIGVQGLHAERFLVRREAQTGSFLAPEWRGRGFGTLARHGIVAAAFDQLAADWVTSAAIVGNAASKGVSVRVGYQPDGLEVTDNGGRRQVLERFRLPADHWAQLQSRAPRVVCRGFEEFRTRIGLDVAPP